MTSPDEDVDRFARLFRQGSDRYPGGLGRLGPMSQTIHDRQERSVSEPPGDVLISRLGLSRPRHSRNTYLNRRRFHLFHFVVLTVVPSPALDTISNSSISRCTPGSPNPRPPDVE